MTKTNDDVLCLGLEAVYGVFITFSHTYHIMILTRPHSHETSRLYLVHDP